MSHWSVYIRPIKSQKRINPKFISKLVVFIKIKWIVEKWTLRSKSIVIAGTNMIVTRMIIFLWLNSFRRLQPENMCWIFDGFQGLNFVIIFCQQFDDVNEIIVAAHNPFLDFSWPEGNLVWTWDLDMRNLSLSKWQKYKIEFYSFFKNSNFKKWINYLQKFKVFKNLYNIFRRVFLRKKYFPDVLKGSLKIDFK